MTLNRLRKGCLFVERVERRKWIGGLARTSARRERLQYFNFLLSLTTTEGPGVLIWG